MTAHRVGTPARQKLRRVTFWYEDSQQDYEAAYVPDQSGVTVLLRGKVVIAPTKELEWAALDAAVRHHAQEVEDEIARVDALKEYPNV